MSNDCSVIAHNLPVRLLWSKASPNYLMLMYNLYLLKQFNNYHSRKIKFSEDIEDYLTGDYGQPYDFKMNQPTKVDFNPADGVTTTVVVNWKENFEPDYCIVQDDVEDAYGNKAFTCWFVMEWVRTRGKQYKCTLRRDVVRDHFYPVLNAHSFIEKAILPNDGSNPLIFNNENMTYNQIKKDEVLLKDKTDTAWIVGYCQKDAFTAVGKEFIATPQDLHFPNVTDYIELNDPLNPTNGGKLKRLNGNLLMVNNVYVRSADMSGGSRVRYKSPINIFNSIALGGTTRTYNVLPANHYSITYTEGSYDADDLQEALDLYGNSLKTAFFNLSGNNKINTNEDFVRIGFYASLGQPVYINGQVYKLTILTTNTRTEWNDITSVSNPTIYAIMNNIYQTIATNTGGEFDVHGNPYALSYKVAEVSIKIEAYVGAESLKVTVDDSHTKLEDSPYDMFFCQYNLKNLNLIQTMVRSLTTAKIFDVQVLPYCPFCNVLDEDGTIRRTLGTEGIDYYVIENGNDETVDYLYFATKSSRSFSIEYEKGIEDYKIENETEFIRLVSPNWNGAYDFSPAKNGGLFGFSVDITYKPISPYIHVAPIFGGIYGNIQDARGLICNGDFSISMMSDSWSQYEINNKNYQNIFNAQIKTMDKNNGLMRGQQIASSMINSVATGIGAGAFTGNAAVGLVAGAASAIGGAIDVGLNQQMYQNNRQLQIDQFGYQLQNIAARPDTLNKVSTLTANNMLFPFIEFYSATDEEKEMLKNKIKFNGMTVMAIGNIADYSDNFYEGMCYVQARIIHIDDNAPMDYHMMATINEEMMKGVYIVWLSNQA